MSLTTAPDRARPHRSSGMDGARPAGGRDLSLDGVRRLAGLARMAAAEQEGLRQRGAERRHARGPLFPRRQRLHAGVRPDAQRQSRAWLAVSARRLYRLRRRAVDQQLVPRRRCRHAGAGRDRGAAASPGVSAPGRRRIAPDAGDDRHLHRRRRSDARGLGRQDLSVHDTGMARRRGRDADHHGDQVQRTDRHHALSLLSARRLRRGRRDRRRPLAGAQQDQSRHDDPRRRRRSRDALRHRRQRSLAVCRRVRDRRHAGGLLRRRRRLGVCRSPRAKTFAICWLRWSW